MSQIKLTKYSFHNEESTKDGLCNFILSADKLSMGDQCCLFEENFSKKQGRNHSVFVSSGSTANLILIQSLLNIGKLDRGDIVGVSALTWSTNIMPLIQLGLVPVLIDIEIDTLNVSTSTLRGKISGCPKLKALFITNALGFCDDLCSICKFCEENEILLLEDNCESLGSVCRKRLGNYGLASTFSFFVGHHLSTIEGGMICTDDEELAKMLRMTRAHGWARDIKEVEKRQLLTKFEIADFYASYTFFDLAFNARNTEIAGYIGNTQIEFWDEIVTSRQSNFWFLHSMIATNPDILGFELGHMETVSNFAFPVICEDISVAQRKKEEFERSGVEIRPLIGGDMTKQPFWSKYRPSQLARNTSIVSKNGFYVPNNPHLSNSELDLMGNILSG